MKRKNKRILLLVIIGAVCIGAVYCGIRIFRHSTDDKMTTLEKPDYIKLSARGREYTLEPDTKDYTALYDVMKQGWEDSKANDGKLAFVLLAYLDKEPKDTLKVTYYYENPIKWTMYGEGEGREIWAHTYTFFPFDQEQSGHAVISENETYLKDAFIIDFRCTEELKELLSQYQ